MVYPLKGFEEQVREMEITLFEARQLIDDLTTIPEDDDEDAIGKLIFSLDSAQELVHSAEQEFSYVIIKITKNKET